jgi:uncharacterized protein YbjT (DUF2867 family)
MILVTGGTGTVGREVVAQLLAAGQKFRVLTRDPAKARFDPKVEVVVGDLGKPESLPKALEGVDRVFALTTGMEIVAHDQALAAAAKKAGAKHIVKLSVFGIGAGGDMAILRRHEAGEKAIQESGLAWTFVRPGMFMSNALNWAGSIKSQGKIFLPYGEGKVPSIHPRDIAAVAVKAMTSPGHEGKAYPLTGSETTSMAEVAQIFSEEVGKPIQYVSIPDEAAREGMLKAGMHAGIVDDLLKMAGSIRAGQLAAPVPTVEQVLGRKALTWRDWARENAAAFR